MIVPLSGSGRLHLLAARIERRLRAALPGGRTTYVFERVSEYGRYWSEAAVAIGASFEELLPGVWEARRGERRTRLVNFVTQCDDPVILRLAGDKPYGYRLAAGAGVPVPEHRLVTTATMSDAHAMLDRIGAALAVKPAAGSSSGLGVSTGVRTRRELGRAVGLASLYDERVLVERMVPGESYRLLYLAGRAIHAVRRRGVRVVGDGHRPLSELIRMVGDASLRDDPMVEQTVAVQGRSLSTVPRAGEEILIRGLPVGSARTRELRTVYDEAVLDRCGSDLIRDGAAVVSALGSELAGVDVITSNPAVSLSVSRGAFIEINTTPGIHHHYVGRENGSSPHEPPVAAQILEYLLSGNRAC